ncbi:hypothetical protein ABFX02_06G114500 [Erythranthe guttata]
MGWCRRSSKLISDAFRCYRNSKIPAPRKPPIQEPGSRTDLHTFSLRPNSIRSNISGGRRRSPFLDGAKRFYYVDRNQVQHFKPRGYKKWLDNPRNTFTIIAVGSGIVITVYFGNLETVPYTKRTHFVLLSQSLERELGDSEFKKLKAQYKGKILPPLHPESIRVQRISHEIIEGLQRGLTKEEVWSDVRYSTEIVPFPNEARGREHDGVRALGDGVDEGKWDKDEEIFDDRWVEQSRRKGREKGMESQTKHLEGLKWEIIVVDDPMINAFCVPGGKIVVFTGLLDRFRADAEVATVIAHEVGHAVARHSAEQVSKNLWLTILQLILYQFFMPDVVNTMSHLLLRLPFSRRMEMEADYIGLLLLASAGYDPRVAPQVYEKLGKVAGDSVFQDYLATHPSAKKRSQFLSQAKVMEEAFDIYREVQSGRGVEGFL